MSSVDSYSSDVRPDPEPILPDPETDQLALSVCKTLGGGTTSTVVKQMLRAKEIVAMTLHLCGYNGQGWPRSGEEARIASFLHDAEDTHKEFFRAFLRLKLPHYKPPSQVPQQATQTHTVTLGPTTSTTTGTLAKTNGFHTVSRVTPAAILDLLSAHSRNQLHLTQERPRMWVADAIGLLIYLEQNDPWFLCNAFQWGHATDQERTSTPQGEERIRTLRSVIRWLVGLEPCETVPEAMGQDVRPMWGRVMWLKEQNAKDMANRFKTGQAGWGGWKWLVAIQKRPRKVNKGDKKEQK